MQPYDYTLRPPQQNMMTGIQQGVALSQIMDKAKQEQAAKEANIAMQTDLARLSSNPSPTAEDYGTMMTKYPKLSEQLKRSFDVLSEGQKKTAVSEAGQIHSAIASDRPDIALNILEEKKEAAINSGNEAEAKKADIQIQLIKTNPGAAKTSTAMFLATTDPDKFSEHLTKVQTEQRAEEMQPAKVIEAESKAQSAAVKANFAESEAAIGLAKQGWDIAKISNDINVSRENVKIATAKSALDKETNQLKKDELALKVKDMEIKRDEKAREVAATAESGMASIDNMLNSTERFFNTADDVIADATGPIESRLLTLDEDTADFEELVDTMSSQAFMAMIPSIKGTGSLSDAEGKKLSTALQSLSLRQSPKRLKDNVKEIQRILTKSRTVLSKKYGVRETTPDTPAAELTTPEIDALLQKYGE